METPASPPFRPSRDRIIAVSMITLAALLALAAGRQLGIQAAPALVNGLLLLLAIGAGDRFCAIQGGDLMPLYSEAEDSILPLIAPAPHLLGACSAGIQWVNDHLAGMSLTSAVFTDGMASA